MSQTSDGRSGILAGGNWVIDRVKVIDHFPDQDGLSLILDERGANGGSPYNVLKDLARMEAPFPLAGIGLLGNDPNGDSVIEDCRSHKIDTSGMHRTEGFTSYTDVMSVQSTGRRTFFHQKGTNALLGTEHFNLSASRAKIFQLGYLLLLDRLDEVDAEGRTGASRIFEEASRAGFKTACDVVSANSDLFRAVVGASLPHIDYFVANEYEAGKITGHTLSKEGSVDRDAAAAAARNIVRAGVREWVVIHFPTGALAMGRDEKPIFVPSLQVPESRIRGAVGAGDAFAAGLLYGLHEEWSIQRCLELASGAAATCLFDSTASNGVLPAAQCLALAGELGYRDGTA